MKTCLICKFIFMQIKLILIRKVFEKTRLETEVKGNLLCHVRYDQYSNVAPN